MEQASIGFEKIVNLTSGANFYSQISDMHDVGNSIVASEQDLRILSEHIHELGNVEIALKADLADKQSVEVVFKDVVVPASTNSQTIKRGFASIKDAKMDLSYEEFCVLAYNASEYLKSFGLDVNINELYAPIYVQNISYISEETKNNLIANGLISEDIDTTLNYDFSILSLIATYNDNLYIKGLAENRAIDYSEVINVSKLFVNENDRQIANLFDESLTDYINSGKKDTNLYTALFANYKKQIVDDVQYYGLDQASVGALTGINLTSGGNFFAHIGSMHPVDGKAIATDEQLVYLSEDIHDINEICIALGQQCQKIK